MAGRHADDELTLGHGGELKWWRLGVRRAKRRLQGDEREVKRPGSQRSGERRRGRLPQRDLEMRRKGRQRVRHESGRRGGERAEAHWPGDGLGLPGQLTAGDVQLIEDTDGCAEQARPRRRQRHAGAAAIKEPSARGRLKRRDLPRDRGLRVSERVGGGRERPRLGDLPEGSAAQLARSPRSCVLRILTVSYSRLHMATASYGERHDHSRIALVTGANQGLGRALVEGLAAGTVAVRSRLADRVAP